MVKFQAILLGAFLFAGSQATCILTHAPITSACITCSCDTSAPPPPPCCIADGS